MSQPGPPAPRGDLKRLSVLIATNFVDMIGFSIILPLLPFYALKLQSAPFGVGIILAGFSIAQLVSAPFWGRFSDRYGRRPALLVGLLASAAAYVVFAFADSFWLLLLSRLVQGAGGGTTGVAQAYVADTVAPDNRARALGWLSAATSAGVMLGPVIGSGAAYLGWRPAPGLIAAALCLVNAAFCWRWLPESRPRQDGPAPAKRPVWSAAWQVVAHPTRPASRLILVYFAGMLAFSVVTAVLAIYLAARLGITEKTIGPVFTYTAGLSVVMRAVLLGPIVDRIGETWAMRLGAVALIAGLLLYPVPTSWAGIALVIPFVPVGTALLFPSTTALLSRTAGPAEQGLLMGVAQTFAGLARVIAPLAGTAAFQRFSHGTPFYLAAAVVAVALLLCLRIEVVPPRRRASSAG